MGYDVFAVDARKCQQRNPTVSFTRQQLNRIDKAAELTTADESSERTITKIAEHLSANAYSDKLEAALSHKRDMDEESYSHQRDEDKDLSVL